MFIYPSSCEFSLASIRATIIRASPNAISPAIVFIKNTAKTMIPNPDKKRIGLRYI